jgi:uncharacterized protein
VSPRLSEVLKNQQFCLLTTFKKSGEGVASPMWFVLEGEVAYMTTRGQSWKAKRIRRNPEVTIGWCDSSGRKHGELFKAEAILLEDGVEFEDAKRKLDKKYGLKKKLIDFGLKFAKDQSEAILRVAFTSAENG